MSDPPLVLILSARSDDETFKRVTREGVAGFVAKPFRFPELVATCQTLLSMDTDRSAPQGAPVRRVARRLLVVEVTVLSREGAPFFRGELVNLSTAGAQVELSVPLEAGDTLRLAVLRPERAKPVNLQGRVLWRTAGVQGHRHGVAFEDLPPKQEQWPRDLLGQAD